MEFVEIDGVNILFPYKPYDIQIDYMRSIIECLQKKTNALLESPTGTGKTLSLLCACLAWLQTQQQIPPQLSTNSGDKPSINISNSDWPSKYSMPKIIYSSRTHQQLSQAIGELKRTYYNTFPSVVIGSREQLCINEDVRKLDSISAKNQLCRSKIANHSCPYYENYETKILSEKDYTDNKVLDIEDLITLGKKHTCCPYYASRALKSKAAVVFSPYNYIIDPNMRRTLSIELRNCVVIFDEGHNIERVFEDCASTELKSETLALCITEITKLLEILKNLEDGKIEDIDDIDAYKEMKLEDIALLKMIVCDLEVALDGMISNSKSSKSMHKTELLFDIMERVGIGMNNCIFLLSNVIDKISMMLTNSKSLNHSNASLYSVAFQLLSDFIETLIPCNTIHTQSEFEIFKVEFIKNFRIFSEKGGDSYNDGSKKVDLWSQKPSNNGWTLHLWCFSPSFGTKSLLKKGIRNIIITSGTLAPLNSFEVEMDVQFPVKLQNKHVISRNQICITTIGQSIDGVILTSKYDNKDNMDYYRALGNTLIDLMKIIPNGVFIFFSSYTSMNKCIQVWKSKWNIWDTLNGVKQMFIEPRGKQEFFDSIAKYKNKIDLPNSSGAAFLGVCRGKLAEGLDLPNYYCRCVIMTGLPFPAVADPKVIMKKQYIDQLRKPFLTANGWYSLQMKRALNQAIGRVLRHKDDFGAVILCDSRFAIMNDGLSKWIEAFMSKDNLDYRGKLDKINSFFKQNSVIIDSLLNSQKCKTNFRNISTVDKTKSIDKTDCGKFADEIAIIDEFKCTNNGNIKSKPTKVYSIFDSMCAANKRCVEELCSKPLNDITVINEIPNKRKKLNIPLRSPIVSGDPVPSTSNSLQSVMKDKTSRINYFKNIDNSGNNLRETKKVHWHAFSNKCLSEHNLEEVVKPINSDPNNDELLKMWQKRGAELRELFKNTKKFQKLCEAMRKYKSEKNLVFLAHSINDIFYSVETEKRDEIIKDLAAVVPKSEKLNFFKNCRVKVLYDELDSTQKVNIIHRRDNLKPMSYLCHSCILCKIKSSLSPHRTLCCGIVGCFTCLKFERTSNGGKCFNCGAKFKLSDLKRLRFNSALC